MPNTNDLRGPPKAISVLMQLVSTKLAAAKITIRPHMIVIFLWRSITTSFYEQLLKVGRAKKILNLAAENPSCQLFQRKMSLSTGEQFQK